MANPHQIILILISISSLPIYAGAWLTQLAERSIKALGNIITGDGEMSPYRSGPKLVELFNDFGPNDRYGKGFPSRWMYAENSIRKSLN